MDLAGYMRNPMDGRQGELPLPGVQGTAPNPPPQGDETGAVVADLLASLAAIGRSIQEEFDPQRFLGEFSSLLQRVIPHDRLVIDHLGEDGRTFTVFAEHAPPGLVLHEEHYTTRFAPQARYVVAEWGLRHVFAGQSMLVRDFPTDPRFAETTNPAERRLMELGLRSGLLVPLESGGRVIGALVATSLAQGGYTDAHLRVVQQVAALIGPFIENVVLLQRERRRRRRLRALQELTQALGSSLNVRDIFNRLADATRPILDFDVMGVALLSTSGREVEMVAEVDDAPTEETPARIPLEHFSFAERVASGESVLIDDAPRELLRESPGDRLIIDGSGRSCLIVPLLFGERVGGGLYFGKRQAHWYDRLDVEIAAGIAAQVVLAVQHQHLAEDQRRLALAEGRARKLEQRVASLQDALEERYGFDRIIGRAAPLKEALALAAKVAPAETTVLITGESGTGKELVARAIHHASPRADGPFVTVNCAALPETLLESELFGHDRGAFTGADRQKPGRFEIAAGGSLFLDEVGELPPAVQAKLLRVLHNREFERVGGTATLHADVRLIAATNRDLERAVADGTFREDLYYRLNVLRIHLPPLRDRGQDVLLLADSFVSGLAADMGMGEVGLSREARDALLAHPWPGNIRELQNAIERALIVSDGGLITAGQLGLSTRGDRAPTEQPTGQPTPLSSDTTLLELEKRAVQEALTKAHWNKSKAAALLGITRSQLYTRLKRFSLDS
jgi:transcriptional regulator with GAF, ATPase, and Fis domain